MWGASQIVAMLSSSLRGTAAWLAACRFLPNSSLSGKHVYHCVSMLADALDYAQVVSRECLQSEKKGTCRN